MCGQAVGKFRLNDYYRLFSAVFQDVQSSFFSLGEIVAGIIGDGVDYARAEDCMRKAVGEKLDALPQGAYAKLDKKDAPILVLDEPTAALDLIAENRVYLQYRELAKEKTSLFISHRLASTQFCDRIFSLEGGKIAEEGTHAQLIAKGGEYSRLYEMQSCRYRENFQKEGEEA